MGKRGPKPIEITPSMIHQAEQLASVGLTKEQIAYRLGFAKQTLYDKIKETPELLDAIKRGQASGIENIANALYDKAMEGDTTSAIFYLKARAGWSEKQQIEHSGGTTNRNINTNVDPKDMTLAELNQTIKDALE